MVVNTVIAFVKNNAAAISLVADGRDMWNGSVPALVEFRKIYLLRYAALPTNTQFGEQGVKELGYVTLGRRNKSNRSILAISQGTLLPGALAVGRSEIECQKKHLPHYFKGKRQPISECLPTSCWSNFDALYGRTNPIWEATEEIQPRSN